VIIAKEAKSLPRNLKTIKKIAAGALPRTPLGELRPTALLRLLDEFQGNGERKGKGEWTGRT